ncbi:MULTISPECIES: MFS transporter [Nostocales]|uniref:MFS transporter n=2 Tax=Nostocales TaxID=1161 RepID=A0A0C1RER1_9CYAN|nr:MFS transporter [Tolypothrix bouteillei]KAF3886714.1 hypothetical protein DA73_0400015425 [Tolypothrix bouteillei VB521301]
MLKLFCITLGSSIGSTVMWLLLVPFLKTIVDNTGQIGEVGMTRQISSLVGSLLVCVWADEGKVLMKFMGTEIIQFILAILFLGMLIFAPANVNYEFVLVWTALRFGIIGASSIVSYKIVGQFAGSWGKGAIIHMLTSQQGAMVFASIICALIPLFFSAKFETALVIDAITSLLLVIFIYTLRNSPHNKDYPKTAKQGGSLLKLLMFSVQSFWYKKLFPWNSIQLVFLVSLSGMMVYAYKMSNQQTLLPEDICYSLSWFFYGFSLWLGAFFIQKLQNDKMLAVSSAGILALCGGLGILAEFNLENLHIIIYILCTYVNAIWLHLTNKKILENAPEDKVARVRSGMVLYLAFLFGIGEFAIGHLLDLKYGLLELSALRIGFGLVLALLGSMYFTSKDRSLINAAKKA